MIERDLELLGAVGIEDQLQAGVPETLRDLSLVKHLNMEYNARFYAHTNTVLCRQELSCGF